jgi:DivIVA domain-containing protein
LSLEFRPRRTFDVPFSSQEIENKEFVVALRGYQKDEVRVFLRAVASDYRAALERGRDEEKSRLESLSEALSEVIQSARESTDGLRRRLENESSAIRRRAEEEAAAFRSGAERDARAIRERAERQATEMRAAAERLMGERLEEVARKTEELHAIEEKLRRRFYFLEMALQLARQDLGSGPGDGGGSREERPRIPVSARHYLDSPTEVERD